MRILQTMRFRLLVVVNASMIALLLIFMISDYYREIRDRTTRTQIALEKEAWTLLPAIRRLAPLGLDEIQLHIDDVCGQMRDSTSPGHHISVQMNGIVLQATAHGRDSSEMHAAMQRAEQTPTREATIGDEEFIMGIAQDAAMSVFVVEHLTGIVRSARRHALMRVPRIGILAGVLATAINMVFLRLAAKPLEELVRAVRQIARGHMGVRARLSQTAEFDYLAHEFNAMSYSLATAEQQRKHEMLRARRIQEHLLPRQMTVPGLSIAYLFEPAADVAGDYYDLHVFPDGSSLICIADVSGHGVPAAMSATILKTLLQHTVENEHSPGEILKVVNARFAALSVEEVFATMLLVRWTPTRTSMDYASAGHEIGWLLSAADGQLRELRATGMMLGVSPDTNWETETVSVDSGDRLLLVTDGVTEAFDAESTVFGRQRLGKLLAENRQMAIPELVADVDRQLRVHRGGGAPIDDTTLIAIQFMDIAHSHRHSRERTAVTP